MHVSARMLAGLCFAAGGLSCADPCAAQVPEGSITQERLREIIEAIPYPRASTGLPAAWRNLVKTEEYVLAEFRALGYEPTTHEIEWKPSIAMREDGERPEPPTYRNIIVEVAGSDLAEEIVVVSAHMDAAAGAPGADDDASGLAAIIEIARVVKDIAPRRTIRIIAFNIEEPGTIGSRQYVSSILSNEPRPKIVGAVSVEMIGYFSDEPDSQKLPVPPIKGVFEPPTVGNFIGVAGIRRHRAFHDRLVGAMRESQPDLPVVLYDFLPAPVPDMLRSDHAPFLLSGYPAVMVTDTANFRNPHYHKATDSIETLDFERMTMTARAICAGIIAAANAEPEKPAEPADQSRD